MWHYNCLPEQRRIKTRSLTGGGKRMPTVVVDRGATHRLGPRSEENSQWKTIRKRLLGSLVFFGFFRYCSINTSRV